MPKLRHLANRTQERDLFLQMAEGTHDCRILFIEGASGMGKTSLLNRFKQECPPEIKYVPFDCKGVASIAGFLSEVVNDLGRDQFPTFLAKVKVFVQGGVDFSENDIAAEKTISIAINSQVDPATEAYRLEQLQGLFFDDLAKLEHRTVIALDTYQLAGESLRNWVESKWLRAIGRRLPKVVTVIAGQTVPEPNHSVWCDECEHVSLTPIVEVNAWCEFCPELPEDAVRGLVLAAEGHPANVHQTLLVVKNRWPA